LEGILYHDFSFKKSQNSNRQHLQIMIAPNECKEKKRHVASSGSGYLFDQRMFTNRVS
jgi:hypothetical protein